MSALQASLAFVKKNYSLVPLFFFTAVGMAGATGYTIRLATKNPDVCWDRKNNPHPNDRYTHKQYKFYSPIRDYSKEAWPAERPNLDE